MEDNFRNVLIILSAIVIIAIFIHGVWTIRKQKNPYKLKATKNKVAPLTRDFDNKGFDQDGVSQVKVTKTESLKATGSEDASKVTATSVINSERALSQSQVIQNKELFAKTSAIKVSDTKVTTTEATASQKDNDLLSQLDSSMEADWFKDNTVKNTQQAISADIEPSNNQFSKDELGDALTPTVETHNKVSDKKKGEPEVTIDIEPLYEQPVTRAKPSRRLIKKVKKPLTKAELKKEQIEIDFDNQLDEKITTTVTEPKKAELEPQVIILSVVMPVSQQMFGAALLPSLLTLGLKYGEMNIFHRHEDNAGNGKVTFSLANILNPGTFDLDSMENFATRGVSLFMTLPNAGDSFAVFKQMLNAAKQLAQEFNAQVLDDKRNVLTKQSEQHYFNLIREFDRKNRIALVE